MANCRKGDIAMIIQPLVRENLGALVEVIELSNHEPKRWRVRPVGGPRLASDGKLRAEANVADAALRPIRGQRSSSAPRRRAAGGCGDLFAQ